MDTKDKKKAFLKLIITSITFSGIALYLIFRIFDIMFINNREYQKEAYLQKTSERVLTAKRGNLYDRNGELFSLSTTVSTFFLDPRLINEVYGGYETDNDAGALFEFLSTSLELEVSYLISQLEYDTHYRVIARDVPGDLADSIMEYRDLIKFRGLFREKNVKRFYPNSKLGAHIIGFTDQELIGRLGLELQFQSLLQGINGKMIAEVDGLGREIPFSDTMEIAPEDGAMIYMTIDKTIQFMAQNALKKAVSDYGVLNGGSITVMEPETGRILAIASYPEFDSNAPYENSDEFAIDISALAQSDIEYLMQSVWRNKAISDTYEPGSTFKVITAAACLEDRAVTADEVIAADPVVVEGWEISHWMEEYKAYESFTEAMYTSSNPVFVRAAQRLGITRFYSYVERFGFKGITGIALPGEGNSIFRDRPSELDMAVNSFGQRFQITPIQLITSYCAIANGGYLIKPQIVDKILSGDGKIIYEAEKNIFRQVISEETSALLRQILEGTVTYGTGKNAYVKGYRVAGKTGTSETLQTDEGRYIASFAGFAPADAPRIAILVVLDFPTSDHHGGGYVAAPTAGDLIEAILVHLRVERSYTDYDMDILSKETKIPDLIGKELKDAENILQEENINYQIIGTIEDTIIKQVPAPGAVVSEKPTVVLYSKNEENRVARMPDLMGYSKDQALARLRSMNLNVYFKGFGEVISQQYEPGEMLEPGSIIMLELREMEFANED